VWAFVLASSVVKFLLQASNSIGTYSNEFKTSKSTRNDCLFVEFGLWML